MLLREPRRGAYSFRLCVRSLFYCLIAVPAGAWAQPAAVPTVAFTCDFPGSDPSHYTISIAADGHVSYTSDGKLAQDSQPDTAYTQEFTLSSVSVAHIFDLTKQAHYFDGKLDSGKKNIASTGQKSLSYQDADKKTAASYNYSPIPAVQDLTSFFQNLSATLEFGRRIDFERHYQKLALDEELKRLEEMAGRDELVDISVIAPTLQKVLADSSVMNTVRARAQRLLEKPLPASK
jgi:hypothetical protein